MTTATSTTNQARQQAGALSTSALIGFRLFEAAGWRIGAAVVALFACPIIAVGGMILEDYASRPGCVDFRGEIICNPHYDALIVGLGLTLLGILFMFSALGLWRRGGAVRDVELLAEKVEG